MAVISRGFGARRRESTPDLPPGQFLTTDFPVLSAGPTPEVDTAEWEFLIRTETGDEKKWSWDDLQALPQEIKEAARVDGASAWQGFWEITFPLMLPVSITAMVLRIIFELKLADIVINVTAGGPGGATDTVSSFIFREYRDRSNVGYGTMLAEFYLVIIIVFISLLLKFVSRWMQKPS